MAPARLIGGSLNLFSNVYVFTLTVYVNKLTSEVKAGNDAKPKGDRMNTPTTLNERLAAAYDSLLETPYSEREKYDYERAIMNSVVEGIKRSARWGSGGRIVPSMYTERGVLRSVDVRRILRVIEIKGFITKAGKDCWAA